MDDLVQLISTYKLTSSDKVNQELSKIIALILRDFIKSWFAFVSEDTDFYAEIIKTLSSLIQEIERRLNRIDWIDLLAFDIPKLITNHIRDFRLCSGKLGTAYAGSRNLEELFYGTQPHIALSSENSESEYMRKVSDVLLDTMLPESELQSDFIRLLLRELLCNNVLLMLVQTYSDPDFVNEQILLALDPSSINSIGPKDEDSEEDYYTDASSSIGDSENDVLSDFATEKDSPIREETPKVTLNDVKMPDSLVANDKVNIEEEKQKTGLFKLGPISQKSFRLLKKQKEASAVNVIAQGINKMTNKMSHKIDKIKDFVADSTLERVRRRKSMSVGDHMRPKKLSSENEHHLNDRRDIDTLSVFLPEKSVQKAKSEDLLAIDDSREIPNISRVKSIASISSISSIASEKPLSPPEITVTATEDQQNIAINFWDIIKSIYNLHLETKNGPWKLGPINTTTYHKHHLEEASIEMLSTILDLDKEQYWSISHVLYFTKPILDTFCGHIINRGVMCGIYQMIREESVSNYLMNFREGFWPNYQPMAAYTIRSESQKAKIKELLHKNLIKLIPASIEYIMKKEESERKVKEIVGIFQNRRINKHLLYLIFDLVLVHVAPEVASPRTNFD